MPRIAPAAVKPAAVPRATIGSTSGRRVGSRSRAPTDDGGVLAGGPIIGARTVGVAGAAGCASSVVDGNGLAGADLHPARRLRRATVSVELVAARREMDRDRKREVDGVSDVHAKVGTPIDVDHGELLLERLEPGARGLALATGERGQRGRIAVGRLPQLAGPVPGDRRIEAGTGLRGEVVRLVEAKRRLAVIVARKRGLGRGEGIERGAPRFGRRRRARRDEENEENGRDRSGVLHS